MLRPFVRRRRLQAIGMAVLMAVGGAYALASVDWCGRWERTPAKLLSSARATGPLLAGAAAVQLDPPWPVTVAGYGPGRPTTSRASRPLYARAVVLQVGEVKAAIVSLDVLLVPDAVVAEVRDRSGLPDAWVVATHTHSSLGGYDPRPLAELAGTGLYREGAKNAVVRAAVAALQQATRRIAPTQLQVGAADAGLCRARTADGCDGRLTRGVLTQDGGPLAEWLVLAAHPTLIARKPEAVDPDYPGALAERRFAADAGVALVLQGSGGNASAPAGATVEGFAEQLEQQLPKVAALEQPIELAIARASVTLPHPDASRLVPGFSRVPATNFVCLQAAREAEVSVLRLGPLTWVAVPVEASQVSGGRLEEAAHADRLISLANGYLGYVEPAAQVAEAAGESKRQYYGAPMEEALEEAARIAAAATR